MTAKTSDWLSLVLAMVVFAGVTVLLALLLNLGGDCGPGIERCGEIARSLSFGVLAVGVAGLIWLIVRFARRHRD